MQEARTGSWPRDAHFPDGLLESVRGLNHRFLDLISSSTEWQPSARSRLPSEILLQMAPLNAAQRRAAAGCPYALFDLRFQDEAHWLQRLRNVRPWQISDDMAGNGLMLRFVRLSLVFAWHVASAAPVSAPLLLGMSEVTATAFRGTNMDCFPDWAEEEAVHLTARWSHCTTYWGGLARAAARPDFDGLRHVQLSGLQLAAAARLP